MTNVLDIKTYEKNKLLDAYMAGDVSYVKVIRALMEDFNLSRAEADAEIEKRLDSGEG